MPQPRSLTLALPALSVAQLEAIFIFVDRLLEQLWTAFENDLLDLAVAQSRLVLARAASPGPPPPLSGQDAHQLLRLLELGKRALWRMHGDTIAAHLACVDPDAMSDDCGPDDLPAADSGQPVSQGDPDIAF
jgi:hypothetical protein